MDFFPPTVLGLSDIIEKIIPFFNQYPIQGAKALEFSYFKIVARLIKEKAHLTTEGLDQIRIIKKRMNSGRTFPALDDE